MSSRVRTVAVAVGLLITLLVGSVALLRASLRNELPATASGPEAEALADRIERAVDTEAWARTGAVSWVFAGRNRHLWDRERHLARIESGDQTVLIDLNTQDGRAWRGETELTGEDRSDALAEAWAAWCNDSFWLNPLAKLRDGGTARSRGSIDGEDVLVVHYESGGTTPGDRYLWLLDEQDRPRAWRMWVSIIPVPGLEASWDGWIQLSTGAWVATQHELGPVTLELTEVAGAATLAELVPGADIFAPLLEG